MLKCSIFPSKKRIRSKMRWIRRKESFYWYFSYFVYLKFDERLSVSRVWYTWSTKTFISAESSCETQTAVWTGRALSQTLACCSPHPTTDFSHIQHLTERQFSTGRTAQGVSGWCWSEFIYTNARGANQGWCSSWAGKSCWQMWPQQWRWDDWVDGVQGWEGKQKRQERI